MDILLENLRISKPILGSENNNVTSASAAREMDAEHIQVRISSY